MSFAVSSEIFGYLCLISYLYSRINILKLIMPFNPLAPEITPLHKDCEFSEWKAQCWNSIIISLIYKVTSPRSFYM